jgi:hypothetical protein
VGERDLRAFAGVEPGKYEKLHVIDFHHTHQRHPTHISVRDRRGAERRGSSGMADDSIFAHCAGDRSMQLRLALILFNM